MKVFLYASKIACSLLQLYSVPKLKKVCSENVLKLFSRFVLTTSLCRDPLHSYIAESYKILVVVFIFRVSSYCGLLMSKMHSKLQVKNIHISFPTWYILSFIRCQYLFIVVVDCLLFSVYLTSWHSL